MTIHRTRTLAKRIKHPRWHDSASYQVRGDLVVDVETGFCYFHYANVYDKVDRDFADQMMHEAQNNSKEVRQ